MFQTPCLHLRKLLQTLLPGTTKTLTVKTNHVVILRGVPGSGKTTWATNWVASGNRRLRINRDDIRYALFGRYVDVDENLVTKTHNAILREAMRTHYDIVIDNTNIDADKLRALVRHIERQGGYVVDIIAMDTPLDECVRRDSARDRVVGEDVIRRMHVRLKYT